MSEAPQTLSRGSSRSRSRSGVGGGRLSRPAGVPALARRQDITFIKAATRALRWRRLLEPIGNIPPAEAEAFYEAFYYAALENLALAAQLKPNSLRKSGAVQPHSRHRHRRYFQTLDAQQTPRCLNVNSHARRTRNPAPRVHPRAGTPPDDRRRRCAVAALRCGTAPSHAGIAR